jgi:predicted outer membrane repeat protein
MTDRMLAPARRMLVVGALAAGLMGAPCTSSTCPDPAASNYDPPDNQTGSVARSAVSAAASNNAPCEYACGRLGQLFAGGHGSAVVCYIDRGSEKHWPPPAGSSSPWTQTYTVPPYSVAIVQGHHSPVPTRVNAINASLVLRHIAMIEHRAPAQPSHGGFEDGGAVFVSSGNLTAEYSAFRRNSAGRSGGALNAKDGVFIVVRSCIFDGNRALSFGGAAIRVFHPQTVLIQRSAFTDNSAHSGGAILITGLLHPSVPRASMAALAVVIWAAQTVATLLFSLLPQMSNPNQSCRARALTPDHCLANRLRGATTGSNVRHERLLFAGAPCIVCRRRRWGCLAVHLGCAIHGCVFPPSSLL